MAKLKDGFYKLTASSIGSDLLVLLAGGGAKPISDFAQFNNAYWANIPISNTSSTTTNPTFGSITVPLTGLIVGSKSTDTSPTRVLVCYDTTLVTKYINIGNDPSAGNAGEFHYTYSASTSTSNNVGLGFYSGNRLKLYYNGGSGVGKAVIASAASGGTEYELLHLGNYKNYVGDLYWANLLVQQTASSTTHPTFGNVSIKGGIDTGLNLYTSDAYTRIRFYNASSANNATIYYFGTAYRGYDFVKDSLNLGCLGLVTLGRWNNPTLVVSSNTTTSNSDGKVGIGTTSPKYKLDVNGTAGVKRLNVLGGEVTDCSKAIYFFASDNSIRARIYYNGNTSDGSLGIESTYSDIVITPPSNKKLQVNGHTLINKRLTIGLDLGNWDSSRAELELISPSGQAIDFWMGSGQRDWSISSRTSEESNALKFFSCTSNTITTTLTLEKSGNMYLYGNLHIGKSDTRNYIAFRGTTGDNPGSFDHTYIGENLWGGSESSELILYKGNDIGATATTVDVSGADRIRHIAGGHLFQVYKTALSGSFESICTSTVPVNMLAIHLNSIQTYAPLVIVGEKYSGNYGINMQNSDIVGINALYTADSAEDGGEGLQFSRGNGYYDSIWASSGTLYFSPNGNLNRAGSYSNNYTVLHTGNYTGTLDGRYVNVTGDTMTGNLVIGNTTIYASGTNGGTNSLAVADDCILGDCNVGGVLGLKATNATIAGIKFFNSSSASLGLLTAVDVNTLKWDSNVLLHSSNWSSYIGGDGYVMRTWSIDATGLDLNTWYPVTMQLPSVHWVRIEVKETLSARSKPLWATHDSGFHVIKIWHSIGYGWGTTSAISQRLILQSDYNWCSIDPVRGIGLLSSSSTEYVYVRGGGRYYVSTSHNVVPTLRTSTYTVYDQSVGPTTDTPAAITAMYSDKSIYAPHFYENSDAKLKENINLISSSDNIPLLKEFDWKSDGKHSYGLIAQELEAMGYSELVEESGDHKTVNYSAALSLIVGKLQVKIKELEKEIEILKNKN